MYHKFFRALKNLHRHQRGMTGLETAIILIAYVTVASVLAYSVLSAGIFSAERGKETVYKGLEQAQATMEVNGSVLGLSDNVSSALEFVQFVVGLSIPNSKVDAAAIVVNYFDDEMHSESVNATWTIHGDSTERGTATFIEGDELFTGLITIPAAATLDTYHAFTVQVIPPTGATLTIARTTPGNLVPVIDLK